MPKLQIITERAADISILTVEDRVNTAMNAMLLAHVRTAVRKSTTVAAG